MVGQTPSRAQQSQDSPPILPVVPQGLSSEQAVGTLRVRAASRRVRSKVRGPLLCLWSLNKTRFNFPNSPSLTTQLLALGCPLASQVHCSAEFTYGGGLGLVMGVSRANHPSPTPLSPPRPRFSLWASSSLPCGWSGSPLWPVSARWLQQPLVRRLFLSRGGSRAVETPLGMESQPLRVEVCAMVLWLSLIWCAKPVDLLVLRTEDGGVVHLVYLPMLPNGGVSYYLQDV